MLSSLLAVLAVFLGIAIYYVRVISVIVDERHNIEASPEGRERYKWLYNVSNKLEKIWPIVKDIDHVSWSSRISNLALILSVILLFVAGVFESFAINYSGYILVTFLMLASLYNGHKGIESYERIKPYLPVLFPAAIYQALHMLQFQSPELTAQLTIQEYSYQATKYLAAAIAFILAFIIPYPIAKFEQWFCKLVSQSTLYFIKDFMRLGVKPTSEQEKSFRKAAKESIASSLKVLLALIAFVIYLTS